LQGGSGLQIDAEEAMNAILENIKTAPLPSKTPMFIDPNKSSRLEGQLEIQHQKVKICQRPSRPSFNNDG